MNDLKSARIMRIVPWVVWAAATIASLITDNAIVGYASLLVLSVTIIWMVATWFRLRREFNDN